MLDACPAARRADLLAEARLLADVLAPGADAQALLRMAQQLSAGDRDGEISRAQARLLAAALKRLARDGGVASYQEPHSV